MRSPRRRYCGFEGCTADDSPIYDEYWFREDTFKPCSVKTKGVFVRHFQENDADRLAAQNTGTYNYSADYVQNCTAADVNVMDLAERASTTERYFLCMFFAIQTMTTVGYGDARARDILVPLESHSPTLVTTASRDDCIPASHAATPRILF